MKVLISAFACAPRGYSEGGIGWSIVRQIAEDHEVFVMVSGRFRPDWEAGRERGEVPDNMHVRFVGNPPEFHRNPLVARLGTWREYIRWLEAASVIARNWHAEESFDLVHQVTFATWRVAPRFASLGIPLVWGPIGGVARVPFRYYRMNLSLTAAAFELLREASSFWARHSRSLRKVLRDADVLIAANGETRAFVRPLRGDRPTPLISIAGYSEERMAAFARIERIPATDGRLRLFAGGNMIGSKGLSIALRALAKAKERGVDFVYTIAGGGADEGRARRLTKRLGLSGEVVFKPSYSGDSYIQALRNSDIYLLPSFRETTPGTLIEAMLAGAVPIVAKISAPGEIVDAETGFAVAVASPTALVDGIAEALLTLDKDREELHRRSVRCIEKVKSEYSLTRRRELMRAAYALVSKQP
jgi:glycosyltransferase involved in cell wall biosynthesis